jgi:alkanesulfonate monooxygenase SsuD/methylene tetrahydromethanopterin reductase-like flavin-dependent oxidoreductase (luciferase family)
VSRLDRVGISLWTMQSTAARPGLGRALYRRFREDVVVAEELGFDSIWVGEHRLWYCGWCPAPLHALAAAAAATTRIRLGTAMYLVPQHEPVSAARAIARLDGLSGGRVELGAGLGYRDAEFDALGLRRDRRGKTMDASLDVLESTWRQEGVRAPRIWMGGMSPPAIARAARRGYGLMLPQTLRPDQVRRVVDDYRSQAPSPRPVGMIREVWVDDDGRAAERHRRRVALHYTEEAGSWFPFGDVLGFAAGDRVRAQTERAAAQIAAGNADRVVEALSAVVEAGVEYLALRPVFEFVEQAELHEQLHRLAAEVAPRL